MILDPEEEETTTTTTETETTEETSIGAVHYMPGGFTPFAE